MLYRLNSTHADSVVGEGGISVLSTTLGRGRASISRNGPLGADGLHGTNGLPPGYPNPLRSATTPPPTVLPSVGDRHKTSSTNLSVLSTGASCPRIVPYHYVVRPNTPTHRLLTPKLATPRSSPMAWLASRPPSRVNLTLQPPSSHTLGDPSFTVPPRQLLSVSLQPRKMLGPPGRRPSILSRYTLLQCIRDLPGPVLRLILTYCSSSLRVLNRLGATCRVLHTATFDIVTTLNIAAQANAESRNIQWDSVRRYIAPYTRGQFLREITVGEHNVTASITTICALSSPNLRVLTSLDVRGLVVTDYEEWRDNWLVDLGNNLPRLETLRIGPLWVRGWVHQNPLSKWYKKTPNLRVLEIGSIEETSDPLEALGLWVLSESFFDLIFTQLTQLHLWVPTRPCDFVKILSGSLTSVIKNLTINISGNNTRPFVMLDTSATQHSLKGAMAVKSPKASRGSVSASMFQDISGAGLPIVESSSTMISRHKALVTLTLVEGSATATVSGKGRRPKFAGEIYAKFRTQLKSFSIINKQKAPPETEKKKK